MTHNALRRIQKLGYNLTLEAARGVFPSKCGMDARLSACMPPQEGSGGVPGPRSESAHSRTITQRSGASPVLWTSAGRAGHLEEIAARGEDRQVDGALGQTERHGRTGQAPRREWRRAPPRRRTPGS